MVRLSKTLQHFYISNKHYERINLPGYKMIKLCSIQKNAMQIVWCRAAASRLIPIVNSAVMAMLLLQSELTRIFYTDIAK